MRLLFDQNLSRRLVALLADDFPDSSHVSLVELATSTDREVWEYARDHGYAIASKDSDFGQLAFLYGHPPKVIWLRVGNRSVEALEAVLRAAAPAIHTLGEDEDAAELAVVGDANPEP